VTDNVSSVTVLRPLTKYVAYEAIW
jgi:hypothetical protein